jgi:hypothetical protein
LIVSITSSVKFYLLASIKTSSINKEISFCGAARGAIFSSESSDKNQFIYRYFLNILLNCSTSNLRILAALLKLVGGEPTALRNSSTFTPN